MKIGLMVRLAITASILSVAVFTPAQVPAPIAHIQSATDFNKTAMDATFALRVMLPDASGRMVTDALCTAFAIQKDDTGYILLTAGHCTYNMPVESIFEVSDQMNSPLMLVTPISARFVDTPQTQEDYAAFHLTTSRIYPVLSLGNESSEQVGDEVIVPNFAHGVAKQLARGPISSEIMDSTESCPTCTGQFVIQIMSAVGASGAPVISAKTHKVVGILVSQYLPLGFIVMPISTVQQSLTRPDQYKELHQFQSDQRSE